MTAKNATVVRRCVQGGIENEGRGDAALVFVLEVTLWRGC